ncbi:uncharacterized protein [Glycine max]|uniref:uncharacterized protein n=1 Tax=Glycine max TaxID=3847 RepID=UPI000E21BA86|nr:uncharacterized protein LOC106794614 [Glycine max]|eukprot:XP_025985226.1 uncharacterized protein LOC106794614 [Glycine max]
MALCGILLCITGSEAMFAGLGHFSQLSIKGLIVSSRKNSLQHFKKPWAHEQEPINSLLEAIKVEKGLSKDDKAQKLPLRHWLEPVSLYVNIFINFRILNSINSTIN